VLGRALTLPEDHPHFAGITSDGRLVIPTAEVFLPLTRRARYKASKGGRGSGKSHDRADALLEECVCVPGTRAVCLREVQKSIARSSKQVLEDKIRKYSLNQYGFDVLKTEIRAPGDGVIIFQGMQDHTAESIKSLEGFRIGWVEEANGLSQRSLDLLRPTFRMDPELDAQGCVVVPGSELWFSWNGKHKTDPIDNFFFGGERPPDSIIVEANYYDNPWFPEVLRREMEWDRRRDPEKYAHVWLGEYLMRSEARVFNNWTIDEFETPAEAEFLFGGDWGFSVDPTVLVRMFIDHDARRLFIDREAYKVGCEIDDTPALFDNLDPDNKGMAREWPIVADSARPETISYMRRHGYPRIEHARKGPGSVADGVEFLKSYDIVVHPRCVHCADELTFYGYKTDKLTDKVLPILSDKKNHVVDSIRYALEALRIAVGGAVESSASSVSRSYDGSVQLSRPVAQHAQEGGLGIYAHDTEAYDGGLT
jgi:phage terminase large subunit